MAIISPPKPVESNLSAFGFSQSNFKIAVNNKAFRVLIDKLYSDKIQSIIRELSTNAYDAHIMAGCPERPFDVTLPTSLNPVFTIRDYGVSLTHEQIMTMYVTLFESSKDDSNQQVGAFGLGSKSPFSYTDSFSVTAYLDGLQRSYIVGYDNDGIPSITHVSTVESDAERGFEVSFPVKFQDANAFREAATTVYEYFEVKPNCGIAFNDAPPVLAGSNWKLYRKSHYGNGVFVRQGCVAYPVTDGPLRMIFSALSPKIVIDVPIGSVSVTPSRESLSIDEQTREFLDKEFRRIEAEIVEVINQKFSNAPTVLEAQQVWRDLNWIHHSNNLGKYKRPGMKHEININGYWKSTDKNKLPKIFAWEKNTITPVNNIFFDSMQQGKFLIDRSKPMLRKKIRIREYAKRQLCFIIQNPTNKELERLVRCFGLTADQIVDITTIDDVEVVKKASSSSTSSVAKTGVTVIDFVNYTSFKPGKDYSYPSEFYWVAIESSDNWVRLGNAGKILKDEFLHLKYLMMMFELIDKPTLLLTKQARARFTLDPDLELANLLAAKSVEMKDTVDKALKAYYLCAYLDTTVANELFPDEAELAAKWKKWPTTSPIFGRLFSGYLLDGDYEEIEDLKNKKLNKYPLLGPRNNFTPEAIKEYIDLINNKESK